MCGFGHLLEGLVLEIHIEEPKIRKNIEGKSHGREKKRKKN